jgi:hypothetical protein
MTERIEDIDEDRQRKVKELTKRMADLTEEFEAINASGILQRMDAVTAEMKAIIAENESHATKVPRSLIDSSNDEIGKYLEIIKERGDRVDIEIEIEYELTSNRFGNLDAKCRMVAEPPLPIFAIKDKTVADGESTYSELGAYRYSSELELSADSAEMRAEIAKVLEKARIRLNQIRHANTDTIAWNREAWSASLTPDGYELDTGQESERG